MRDRSEAPELWKGQAVGRPEWQRRLPAEERREIDRLANEAHRSDEAFDAYVAYTAPLRKEQIDG